MAAVFNCETQRIVQHGPAVIEKPRRLRERANDIDNRNRLRGSLDRSQLAQRFLAQFLEKLVLEIASPFICAQDFSFHLFQFRRDETLPAHRSLFARVMWRHAGQIRFRHFNEVTKHRVVTDLERFDSARGDLALLQFADPGFAVARCLPQLVKIDIVTVVENPAFFQRQRRIIDQRLA